MALSKNGLKNRIITELNGLGFDTGNSFSFAQKMAEAIANAVVDEIQANARCSGTDNPSGDTHNNVGIQ